MQQHGYKIYPVNPSLESVLGEKSYASLKDLPVKPDVVNVFRLPNQIPAIVDEMLKLGLTAAVGAAGHREPGGGQTRGGGRDPGGDGPVHYGGTPEKTVVGWRLSVVSFASRPAEFDKLKTG